MSLKWTEGKGNFWGWGLRLKFDVWKWQYWRSLKLTKFEIQIQKVKVIVKVDKPQIQFAFKICQLFLHYQSAIELGILVYPVDYKLDVKSQINCDLANNGADVASFWTNWQIDKQIKNHKCELCPTKKPVQLSPKID